MVSDTPGAGQAADAQGVTHNRADGSECGYLAIVVCTKCGWSDPLYRPGTVARYSIEGEPASKERPRFSGKGTYTPAATTKAELAVGWKFREAARGHQAEAGADYGVAARFFCGNRRRRDIDNMLKLVLDALNGVAWADDSQVTEVSASKAYDPAAARTEIVVYRITGVPAGTGGGT